MINKTTQQQFWQKFETLPEEIQEVFFSVYTAETIYNIAQENNLLEKVGNIAYLVGDVFLGFLAPQKFKQALIQQGEITEEIAEKIAREINNRIFSKTRMALEKLYQRPKAISRKIEIKIPEPEVAKEPRTKLAPRRDVYKEQIPEEERGSKFKSIDLEDLQT